MDEVIHAATYLLRDETSLDKVNLCDDAINLYQTIDIIGKHEKFYKDKYNWQIKNYEKSHNPSETLLYTQSQARKKEELLAKYESVLDLIQKRMSFINAKLKGNTEYELSDHLWPDDVTPISESDMITNIAETEVNVPYKRPVNSKRNGTAPSLTRIDGGIFEIPQTTNNPRVVKQAEIPPYQNGNGDLYHNPTPTAPTLRKRASNLLGKIRFW
ncbi:MAG: hypothetical protein O2779_01490 [Nanoarchaeota archaeon]|nr:hypothetical protein [Nanoarchaeota archaeon]